MAGAALESETNHSAQRVERSERQITKSDDIDLSSQHGLGACDLKDVRLCAATSGMPSDFPQLVLQDTGREAGQNAPSSGDKGADKTAKPGEITSSAEDKSANSPERKDAEEFQKRFGDNPNSPEAMAWIEQKIREHAKQEAKELDKSGERRGVDVAGEAGDSYSQDLLLHILDGNPNFNSDNVLLLMHSLRGGAQERVTSPK